MANIQRGFIVAFGCCLEGRCLKWNSNGFYENLDGEQIGKMDKHYFLIISETTKNNAVLTKYIHAIPISSSNSPYNQERSLAITADMLSFGGNMLLINKSLLKTDSIVSLYKKDYKNTGVIGEISPSSKPYKQILSEVIKNFGCNELI